MIQQQMCTFGVDVGNIRQRWSYMDHLVSHVEGKGLASLEAPALVVLGAVISFLGFPLNHKNRGGPYKKDTPTRILRGVIYPKSGILFDRQPNPSASWNMLEPTRFPWKKELPLSLWVFRKNPIPRRTVQQIAWRRNGPMPSSLLALPTEITCVRKLNTI